MFLFDWSELMIEWQMRSRISLKQKILMISAWTTSSSLISGTLARCHWSASWICYSCHDSTASIEVIHLFLSLNGSKLPTFNNFKTCHQATCVLFQTTSFHLFAWNDFHSIKSLPNMLLLKWGVYVRLGIKSHTRHLQCYYITHDGNHW